MVTMEWLGELTPWVLKHEIPPAGTPHLAPVFEGWYEVDISGRNGPVSTNGPTDWVQWEGCARGWNPILDEVADALEVGCVEVPQGVYLMRDKLLRSPALVANLAMVTPEGWEVLHKTLTEAEQSIDKDSAFEAQQTFYGPQFLEETCDAMGRGTIPALSARVWAENVTRLVPWKGGVPLLHPKEWDNIILEFGEATWGYLRDNVDTNQTTKES